MLLVAKRLVRHARGPLAVILVELLLLFLRHDELRQLSTHESTMPTARKRVTCVHANTRVACGCSRFALPSAKHRAHRHREIREFAFDRSRAYALLVPMNAMSLSGKQQAAARHRPIAVARESEPRIANEESRHLSETRLQVGVARQSVPDDGDPYADVPCTD